MKRLVFILTAILATASARSGIQCSGSADCAVIGAMGAAGALIGMNSPKPQSVTAVPDALVVQWLVGQSHSELCFSCGATVLKVEAEDGSDRRELRVSGPVFTISINKKLASYRVVVSLKQCKTPKIFNGIKAGSVVIAKFDSSCE